MTAAKIAITIDEGILRRVDRLIREKVFPNRSQAITQAVAEKLQRHDQNRLARECAKLNRQEEQTMADEGLAREVEVWPEY